MLISHSANAAPIATPPDIVNNATVTYEGGTIAGGTTVTNNSTINNDGAMINNGNLINNDTFNNLATRNLTNNSIFNINALGRFNNGGIYIGAPGSTTVNNNLIDNTATGNYSEFASNLSGTIANAGIILLNNSVTAGSAVIGNDNLLNFNDTTTAGSAEILGNYPGIINFNTSSSAATSIITNNFGSVINFSGVSTAAASTITNNGTINFTNNATAGDFADITNLTPLAGANIDFRDTSTAGNAKFTNDAAIIFYDNSVAGTATIVNNSSLSTLAFYNTSTAESANITNNVGSRLFFNNSSSAATSTISNNSDSLEFRDSSTADSATITNTATGAITFRQNSNAGGINSNITNAGILVIADPGVSAGGATILNNGTLTFALGSTASTSKITNNATVNFNNTTTAGSAIITNNAAGILSFNNTSTGGTSNITNAGTVNVSSNAGSATILNNNILNFLSASTAGGANITNNAATNFNSTSTAGSAIITNNAAGTLSFNNTSTGGISNITNDGTINISSNAEGATILNNNILNFLGASTASGANITNNGAGILSFNSTSSAAAANITNNASIVFNDNSLIGTAPIANNVTGVITFNDTTNSGSGNFNNNGTINFNDSSIATSSLFTNNTGATIEFNATSNAGTSNIFNASGGSVLFNNDATAANAVISTDGVVDFSGTTTGVTISTLNGGVSGNIFGPGKVLTIGGGTYNGTLGAMASLTKITPASFALNGDNSAFIDNMIVNGGYLNVGSNPTFTSARLGSGAGNLTVNSGGAVGGYGTTSANTVVFNNGSKLVTGLTSSVSASGLLNANSLTLNPGVTLQVEAASPISLTQTYVVSNYGTLSGTFSSVVPIGIVEVVNVDYGTLLNSQITLSTRPTTIIRDVNARAPITNVVFELLRHIKPHEDDSEYKKKRQELLSYAAATSHRRIYEKSPSVLKALSQSGPIIMDQKETRLWVMPYYTNTKMDNVNAKAARSNNEGLIFGYEKRSNAFQEHFGLLASVGLGKDKSPSTAYIDNTVSSKTGSIGTYYNKNFYTYGELGGVIVGTLTHHNSSRYGNPLPGVMYKAKSTYYSKEVAMDLRAAWKFVVSPEYSIRPSAGLALEHAHRDQHGEEGGGSFSQTYLKKITNSLEPYAGIGLRRKWKSSQYEYKLTGVYEHGYECGDNNTITRLTTPLSPGTFDFQTRGAGRNADYVTFYASTLNMDTNVRFMVGYIGAFKKYRKDHTITAKAEMRF